jgi:hypothetical protein
MQQLRWRREDGRVNDAISLLEKWYSARCDGDWEHSYGVTIDTLDNPGWVVKIDLHETSKQHVELEWTKIDRSEQDWVHYRIQKKQFYIACGARNLSESIHIFLNWFESP